MVKIIASAVTVLILAGGGLAVYLLLWTPGDKPGAPVAEQSAKPEAGSDAKAEEEGVAVARGEKNGAPDAATPEGDVTDEKTGVQPKVAVAPKAEKGYHELDYTDPKQRLTARQRAEKDEEARKQETLQFLGQHDRKRKAADERQRALDKWLEKQ